MLFIDRFYLMANIRFVTCCVYLNVVSQVVARWQQRVTAGWATPLTPLGVCTQRSPGLPWCRRRLLQPLHPPSTWVSASLITLGPADQPFSHNFLFLKQLNIGKYAFSVAAPTIWNQHSLLRSSETVDTFRNKKENVLFEIAFLP